MDIGVRLIGDQGVGARIHQNVVRSPRGDRGGNTVLRAIDVVDLIEQADVLDRDVGRAVQAGDREVAVRIGVNRAARVIHLHVRDRQDRLRVRRGIRQGSRCCSRGDGAFDIEVMHQVFCVEDVARLRIDPYPVSTRVEARRIPGQLELPSEHRPAYPGDNDLVIQELAVDDACRARALRVLEPAASALARKAERGRRRNR